MTATHIHLMLNHLPVVGVPLITLVLLWGLYRRSREIMRVALVLAIGLTLVTYVVVRSGEAAEEIVEEHPWASETLIETHEERGEQSLILMLVVGGLSAVALWRLRGEGKPELVFPAIVAGALLVSAGSLGWTAWDGGQVRHDEIRATSQAPPVPAGPAEVEEDEEP